MLYSREKTKIRKLHRRGLSIEEIIKSFPKKIVTSNEIYILIKSYRKLIWYENKTKLKCNSCLNIKEYNNKNFQITKNVKATTCRNCRNLRKKNLRKLMHNTGKYIKQHILDIRRTRRKNIIKILNGEKLKVYKTVDGLRLGEWKKKTGKGSSTFYRLIEKQGKEQ